MSSTFAPSPWPAPAHAPGNAAWRFAREMRQQRDGADCRPCSGAGAATARSRRASCWRVHRRCAVVSLGIGAAFWWLGAPAVLPFAGAELLLVGAGLLVCSRHAGDVETLTLAARELQCRTALRPRRRARRLPRRMGARRAGAWRRLAGRDHRAGPSHARRAAILRPELRMAAGARAAPGRCDWNARARRRKKSQLEQQR